jgi:GntR family transcriptional regulator/MocR family aminotransferase
VEAVRSLPLEIQSPEAGLHCVAWLPDEIDDEALVRKAAKHDLNLWALSRFSINPLKRKGLVLGYGEYSVAQIRDGIRRLGDVMRLK